MNLRLVHQFSILPFLLCLTPALRAAPETPPHADVGADRFPDADAVILRHEQTFTLEDDGSTRAAEHKWVKMLSSRAIRRTADPRIDFRDGSDTVNITVARTFTPDGKVVDVPDYSRNLVSPFGYSNDPAFSDFRQWVVSFSGVQPDAIYELAYERHSERSEPSWLAADLRLADNDPTIERIITVRVPAGVTLQHQLDHVPADRVRYETEDGGRTHRWTFSDLTDCPDESAAPNWTLRCPHLRFTTCPDPTVWATIVLDTIAQSAAPDVAIEKMAREAAKDESDPRAAARKVCDKLAERMRTIDAPAAWSGLRARPASAVFAARYQNALEAAAVGLVALRAAGLNASAAVVADSRTFSETTATDGDVRGFWIGVTTPTERFFVDPVRGIQAPYGDNRSAVAFMSAEGNQLQTVSLVQGRHDDTGRLIVRAHLEIDAKGAVTGNVRVELGGPLVDAAKLQSDDQKRGRVESVARRVFPGLSVTELSVLAFSATEFRAEGKVKMEEGLAEVGRLKLLEWSESIPAADGMNVPLAPRDRDADVSLEAPLQEELYLTVEFPEAWKIAVQPQSLPHNPSAGMTSRITQNVKVNGSRIDVERCVHLPREINTTQIVAVRESINRLRSDGWRQIALHADAPAAPAPATSTNH